MRLLNAAIASQPEGLSRRFAAARPFRHVVVDDFLDAAFCGRLLEQFPRFEDKQALNEFGKPGRKAVVSDLAQIGSAYREMDQVLKSREFLDFMGRVSSVPDLLYDPDYIGGGTHDNLDGQDLDMHVDFNYHPRRMWHRRLNLIVFLNPEWEESWGGCLQLQGNPWDSDPQDVVTVTPVLNRAVLFETTERSWHGFSRISLPPDRKHLSRKSIAVYFYTKDRPEAETADSHGTIYVPRPLPQHFRTGYTLQDADVAQLRELISRRDDQIRFLFERELKFSRLITGITQSVSFRVGRVVTWPLRMLRG